MNGHPIGSRCIVTWAPAPSDGRQNVLKLGDVVTVISEPLPSKTRGHLMSQMIDPADVTIPMPPGTRPGWPIEWMSPFEDPDEHIITRVREFLDPDDINEWIKGIET